MVAFLLYNRLLFLLHVQFVNIFFLHEGWCVSLEQFTDEEVKVCSKVQC